MVPRTDPIVYQKQKYGAHIESDSRTDFEDYINKQYREGIHRIKHAYQLGGRTFVVLSEDIVDKLCVNENTWFRQDLTSNGIVLRILDRNGDGGLS